MTVYYNDDSWYPMVDYMWTHWDQMTGVSFLPKFEGNSFSQAPLNAIDREYIPKAQEAAAGHRLVEAGGV